MDNKIKERLQKFFSKYPLLEFKKGQILIQEGDEPGGIFYIEEGIVRRYWNSINGDEVTFNLYKPYTFLPMSWAISDVTNTHAYAALIDVKARKAPKHDVLAFIKSEPDVLYDLLRRVYIGMEGIWTHMEFLTTGSAYTKLVTSLVILAKRFGKQSEYGIVITLNLSEKDISSYAGLARETTNRNLQKLKKEGLVTFEKNNITVHNLRQLERKLLE